MTLGRPSRFGVPLLLASLLLADVARSLPASAGGTGLWDVRAATVPVAGTFGVQWAFSAYRITQDKVEGTPADRDLVDGGLQIAWSPRSSFEVFGTVNAAMSSYDGDRVISPRDGRLGGKLRLGGWRRLDAALLAHVNLPFGNRTRGFSTDSFDPAVGAAVSWRLPDSNTLTAAYVHFNVGYQSHGDDRGRAFEGWPPYYLEPVYPGGDKDRLDLRAAVELRGERATLFLELLLDRIANDALAWREGPLFLTPGFRYALADEVSFTVGSKITLASDDPSTTRYRPPNEMYPDWQLTFALTWSRDGRDVDRDGDGIPDWRDGCPNEPEDRDGWQDDDGCPDLDNDGDGVHDRYDGAPNDPEDFDGFADADGIPDPDNDGDGVPDTQDICPNVPEDLDGVADSDGCPEKDADRDRILDENDKCPEEPEDYNGIDDEDGCPDSVGLGSPFLLPGVAWEGQKVEPKPASYYDLNELAERLNGEPALLVELRVHSPGPDESHATRLAILRAEYLKAFLVAAGVEPHRVVAHGDAEPSIFDSPFEGVQRIDEPRVEVVPRTGRGIAGKGER